MLFEILPLERLPERLVVAKIQLLAAFKEGFLLLNLQSFLACQIAAIICITTAMKDSYLVAPTPMTQVIWLPVVGRSTSKLVSDQM